MAKMTRIEKFFVNSRTQYYFHRWFVLGKFLNKIPKVSYRSILEIGAGVGITSELLAEQYPMAQILATDFDEDSITVAQRKTFLKNVHFAREDATRLSLQSQGFDAVFSILVLHHIADFQDAISELSRVLKSGGDLYLIDIPLQSFHPFHMRRYSGLGVFSKQKIIELLEQNGFSVQDYGGRLIFNLYGKKT